MEKKQQEQQNKQVFLLFVRITISVEIYCMLKSIGLYTNVSLLQFSLEYLGILSIFKTVILIFLRVFISVICI